MVGEKFRHYTEKEKARALDVYFSCAGYAAQAIRLLGYPTPGALLNWARRDTRYASLLPSHRRYTKVQKTYAVNAYYKNGESANFTCVLIGYPTTVSLLEWVRDDPRCHLKPKRSRRYTANEKMCVVSAYLDESLSYDQAAALVGADGTQALRWTGKYLKEGELMGTQSRKGVPCPRRGVLNHPPAPSPTPLADDVFDEDLREYCENLKFENDVLRAELDLFSKKAEASAKKDSRQRKKSS
ncbi:MAG: hypothetical protein RSD38_03190 [Raoultibacter sp.]